MGATGAASAIPGNPHHGNAGLGAGVPICARQAQTFATSDQGCEEVRISMGHLCSSCNDESDGDGDIPHGGCPFWAGNHD